MRRERKQKQKENKSKSNMRRERKQKQEENKRKSEMSVKVTTKVQREEKKTVSEQCFTSHTEAARLSQSGRRALRGEKVVCRLERIDRLSAALRLYDSRRLGTKFRV